MLVETMLIVLALGLLDALNPYTVATLLILLPLVKRKWHAAIFICGTYIVYAALAILLFFGIDRLLRIWLAHWLVTHPLLIGIAQLVLAGIALIGLIWWSVHWWRIVRNGSMPTDLSRQINVLASPWFIAGLAIVSTIYDSIGAFPLFWLIGSFAQSSVTASVALPLLFFYCLLYVLPMIILYWLYDRMTDTRFKRFEQRFQRLIRYMTYYSIPVFLLVLVLWLAMDGWGRIA